MFDNFQTYYQWHIPSCFLYSLHPKSSLKERHDSVNCLAGIELFNVLVPPVLFEERGFADNFLAPVLDKIIKQAQLLHQICSK